MRLEKCARPGSGGQPRSAVRRGLVLYTFGNASGISRDEGLIVIKPSGVPYESLQLPEQMVITNLDGDDRRRRSEAFVRSGHPPVPVPSFPVYWWGRPHSLPLRHRLGPRPAGEIPCLGTPLMQIISRVPFRSRNRCRPPTSPRTTNGTPDKPSSAGLPDSTPQPCPRSWSPVTRRSAGVPPPPPPPITLSSSKRSPGWPISTLTINSAAESLSDTLRDKHFLRKHGPSAYYGQT